MIHDDELRARIRAEIPDLIAIRRDLHAHPELGYQETRTSGVVRRELERAGIEHAGDLAGGTGVLGWIPGRAATAIGLRADMDALPIPEENDVEHRSQTAGVMHACGHDGHTTMLVGAARVLAGIAEEHELPRPIKLVFQPAEETGAGARRMIDDGALSDRVLGPAIDAMYGLHGWPAWPLGVVGTRAGPLLAASDSFDIEIRGRGSHAAFPHISRDPIVAAAALISALQTLAARETDPLDALVVSVTRVHSGTAYNVIPASAAIAGTFRTLEIATRDHAMRRLHEIAESIATAHRCSARVTIHDGYPVTRNDPLAVERFEAIARRALGAQRVAAVALPVMGAEDFSFYCGAVPSCFFVLGLCPPGQSSMPQLHQATFDFNDDALASGIELFCRLALDP